MRSPLAKIQAVVPRPRGTEPVTMAKKKAKKDGKKKNKKKNKKK